MQKSQKKKDGTLFSGSFGHSMTEWTLLLGTILVLTVGALFSLGSDLGDKALRYIANGLSEGFGVSSGVEYSGTFATSISSSNTQSSNPEDDQLTKAGREKSEQSLFKVKLQDINGQKRIILPGGEVLTPDTIVETGAGYGTTSLTQAYANLLEQLSVVSAERNQSVLSEKLEELARLGFHLADEQKSLFELHGSRTRNSKSSSEHSYLQTLSDYEQYYLKEVNAPDSLAYRHLSESEQSLVDFLAMRTILNARSIGYQRHRDNDYSKKYSHTVEKTHVQTYLDSQGIDDCAHGKCRNSIERIHHQAGLSH
jgi:hypothetical protein